MTAIPTPPPPGKTRPGAVCLALIQALEAGLLSSQKAILARDLAAIEQGTIHQLRLRQELEMVWAWGGFQDDEARSPELLAAQRRVAHLGRIQIALLARSQRYLQAVARLHAGPYASYAPPTPDRQASLERTHVES